MARPKKIPFATCHPDREYHAKGLCRKCYTQKAMRKWRSNNPDAVLAELEKRKTPEGRERRRFLAKQTVSKYARDAGWSKALTDQKLEEQKGCCAICSRVLVTEGPNKAVRMHRDHHHSSATPRDLLCLSCNIRLGYYEKARREGMLALYENYLKKHETFLDVSLEKDHNKG